MTEIVSPADEPEGVAAAYEDRDIFSLVSHPQQDLYFPNEGAADVRELAEDILANGLREHIEIMPDGTIISGHRRRSALIWLAVNGHEECGVIEVLVRYDLAAQGDKAVMKRFLQANWNRRHLTPMDFARITREMYELEHDETCDEVALREAIASRYGISVKTLERRWEMLKLPLELQRLVGRTKGGLTQQLGEQLLACATPEEMEELRQLAAGEETRDTVKARAKAMMSSRAPKKPLKEPPPEDLVEEFFEASRALWLCYDSVVEYFEQNLKERPVMLTCLRAVRFAEQVLPPLLEIAVRSGRLGDDEIAYRPQRGRKLEEHLAAMARELADLGKLPPLEPAEPKLPPLKLRPAQADLPPLKLRPAQKDLPPLKLRKPPAA